MLKQLLCKKATFATKERALNVIVTGGSLAALGLFNYYQATAAQRQSQVEPNEVKLKEQLSKPNSIKVSLPVKRYRL